MRCALLGDLSNKCIDFGLEPPLGVRADIDPLELPGQHVLIIKFGLADSDAG